MELSNNDVMELLDWRPDAPVWCAEWTALYCRPPESGWQVPSAEWIDWARGILSQSIDRYGKIVVARILALAELLHPQGIDRKRLQDALLAIGRLQGRDYQPAEAMVDMAERDGVIRMERVDLWRPGMASGTGWRAYCRLTLYGKSLVSLDGMPEIFPEPELQETPWRRTTSTTSSEPWLTREQARIAETKPAKPEASESHADTCAVPEDFVWSGPYVDQQVRKFFRKHWSEYTDAIRAVINEQKTVEEFGLEFGPKRISGWINDLLRVPEGRKNRCKSQNINPSATYGLLVKAFKSNPCEHAVVRKLQQGQSPEAEAILDEFLADLGQG
jgi:hypothetical protein